MDVLAEEFGNLTPEQLAAPISTVEVRAGHAESGRGRERPQEALPEELAWRGGRRAAAAASAHAQRDGAGLFRSGPPSARGGAELGGARQDSPPHSRPSAGWGRGGSSGFVGVREGLALAPT